MSGHTYKVGNNLCANVTGSPLDYGWKEMKSFSEVLEEEPWTKAKEAAALEEMRKKMEAKHVQKEAENEDEGNEKEGISNEEKKAKDNSKNNNNNENNVGNNNNSGEEGEQAEKKKTRKKPSGPKLYLKEQVRSIKFNNNEINTWVGFDEALKNAIDSETVKSTDLQFLDCSFNMLQTIGSCLEKYDKIRVLYLHGNKIGNLQDIKRLKNLKEIQKLTLHGNPIEEKKNYRKYVTCMLPTLKQLDFTPITLQDRNQAKVWMERRLRNKQRKEEGGY
jgi:hypothetical protein